MALKQILELAGAKIGLSPNAQNQRNVLLRWLNEAVVELYDQADIPSSLMELPMKVNGDQTISLPSYVGALRAVRELDSQEVWHINQMRPRYNQFNWQDSWCNYRLKGQSSLMSTVTNQSVGVLTVYAVESPAIIVTVSGSTQYSADISEDITMDAISKQTTNAYLDYNVVRKNTVNSYDITLSDVDGKLLTIIPNNMLQAKYQIVDISGAPWLQSSSSVTDNYVEILYKKVLPWFSKDADEFPAPGYDTVIVNKMLQLWMEEQGKDKAAVMFDSKATRSIARKIEDQNRATEDCVAFVNNPHDTLLPRI